MEKLAVMGGKSVVTNKHPHYVWPLIETEEREAVIRQMATGEISINDRTGIIKELENDFAKYHGVEYALSVNNGTSALYSAYFACNIHRR
ncbi:MAG: DegT/DnrJ/EryC1/StrS family aminotransferase [Eubacterium ventriosum]